MWIYDAARWPFLTADMPGTGGRLRSEPADFQVDEVREAPPLGEGEHLYARIEKTDMTTRYLIGQLQAATGLPEHAIGHAGMKDRHAVTTQWISLPASVGVLPEIPGMRVLETALHPTKLQEGELRGNAFRLRVRGAEGQAARAESVLARLQAAGVPNYYGAQRFGREGDNAAQGVALLGKGRKPQGWLDKLRAQAVQSWVFNDWLAARLAAGTFATVIAGDVAVKHATGGKFLVGDVAAEAPRAAAFEISATGPMLGRKYHEAQGEARAVEDGVLEALGLTRERFKVLPGTRRPIRTPLADWRIEETEDGFWVAFFLPAGGYATTVMHEIMKGEAGAMEEGATLDA